MPRLAITCGDPAGVGPDVIEAWWRNETVDARKFATLIGPEAWLARLPGEAGRREVVGEAGYQAEPGRPTAAGARVAWAAMERAAELAAGGEVCGVVTGPVSKAALAQEGFAFPGQTEFFAARWGGVPVMGFAGGKLRVVLATWHVPLRDVPGMLTAECLGRTVWAAAALARAQGVKVPRIAVCGLNPHAGEAGLLGTEERDGLDPILDGLRGEWPGLSRCLPGDTVFARQLRGEFDVAVALYHDQGLGPVKTLEFDQAVNVTLGLPHVRTSPDHGTGYDLAGTGRASATSFINAVKLARELVLAKAAG